MLIYPPHQVKTQSLTKAVHFFSLEEHMLGQGPTKCGVPYVDCNP